MSVCVQSCPFALDRAPRVASDAIKRVTFGTEDATFAIVLRIRRARVISGTIKRATFAKRDATFPIVLRIPPEYCDVVRECTPNPAGALKLPHKSVVNNDT